MIFKDLSSLLQSLKCKYRETLKSKRASLRAQAALEKLPRLCLTEICSCQKEQEKDSISGGRLYTGHENLRSLRVDSKAKKLPAI